MSNLQRERHGLQLRRAYVQSLQVLFSTNNFRKQTQHGMAQICVQNFNSKLFELKDINRTDHYKSYEPNRNVLI